MLILLLGVFISAHTVRAVVLSSRRNGAETAVHKVITPPAEPSVSGSRGGYAGFINN